MGHEPEPLYSGSPRLTSESGGCASMTKIESLLPRRKCRVENMSYNLLPVLKFNTHIKLNMHRSRRQKAILKLNVSVPSSLPLSRPHKGHCVSRPFLLANLSPCLPTSFPAWAPSGGLPQYPHWALAPLTMSFHLLYFWYFGIRVLILQGLPFPANSDPILQPLTFQATIDLP